MSAGVDKFRGSHFWQEHKEFSLSDVASYCKIERNTAMQVVHVLRPELTKYEYKSRGTSVVRYMRNRPAASVLCKPWRNPLPWDGDCTPRWC